MSIPIQRARELYMKLHTPVDSYVLVEYDGTTLGRCWCITEDLLNGHVLADDQYVFWGSDDYSKAPKHFC